LDGYETLAGDDFVFDGELRESQSRREDQPEAVKHQRSSGLNSRQLTARFVHDNPLHGKKSDAGAFS
jgi:hypothetical protein